MTQKQDNSAPYPFWCTSLSKHLCYNMLVWKSALVCTGYVPPPNM